MDNRPIPAPGSVPNAPIHPLSALATILLDWLWFMIDVPQTLSVVLLPTLLPTSIALGAICLVAVALVQKFVAKDDWGPSIAKAFVMGIAAGVPYPVVGTVVGVPLLLWAGIHDVQQRLSSSKSQ